MERNEADEAVLKPQRAARRLFDTFAVHYAFMKSTENQDIGTPVPASERRESLLILLGAFVLAWLRSPLLLFHGRVVMEEGTHYLQKGLDSSAMSAFLALHVGYYSLLMNLLGLILARVVPLEWAAIGYTTASLGMLLLTVYLAVTCEEFRDTQTRVLAAAVCLLTPSIEVWLTAEDAQFYLAACTALICISSEHRHRLLRGATLLLAGLSGPVSCIFAPFFLWRAFRRRTRDAAVQAGILVLCALTEAALVLSSVHAGKRPVAGLHKLEWFGPVLFLKIFSVTFFTRLGAFLSQRIAIHHANAAVCLLLWIATLLSLSLFWRLARSAGTAGRMCFGMATFSLVFNYVGIPETLDVILIGAFRYFFTGFLLYWMVLLLAYARTREAAPSLNFKLARGLLAFALIVGLAESVGYWTRFQKNGPYWRTEVAAWRADPAHPIQVWPATWPYKVHPPVPPR
jgi:hypothetical protein